jgi:hypothetical protein
MNLNLTLLFPASIDPVEIIATTHTRFRLLAAADTVRRVISAKVCPVFVNLKLEFFGRLTHKRKRVSQMLVKTYKVDTKTFRIFIDNFFFI